jgi:hypothetical protein
MPTSKPWINNTGNQQKESTNLSVDDLYKSSNVFINGQQVILAGPPQASPGQAAVEEVIKNNDDANNGSPTGYQATIDTFQSLANAGVITQEEVNKKIAEMPPPAVPDNGEDKQSVPESPILVLLFRGLLTPDYNKNSSVQVDATATEINKLQGYRARVFNWEQEAAALSEIKPDDQVVLYGFSKGGETVLKFINSHPKQKFALALTLDAHITVTQNIDKLPSNCKRAVNWFNPNWKYNLGFKFPPSNDRVLQIQDPSTPSTPTHFAFPQKHLQEVLTQIKSLVPRPAQELTRTVNGDPPINAGTGAAGGVGKFSTPMGSQDLKSKISRNFTLGQVVVNGYTPRDQSWSWQDSKGKTYSNSVTAAQVVVNLSLLAQNVLDPIKDKYGDLTFSSTFRDPKTPHAAGNSQHNTGQAADLHFKSGDGWVQMLERAAWIRDNLPYDQLLLECTSKGSVWIHVSYSQNPKSLNDKTKIMSMKDHVPIEPKGQLFRPA